MGWVGWKSGRQRSTIQDKSRSESPPSQVSQARKRGTSGLGFNNTKRLHDAGISGGVWSIYLHLGFFQLTKIEVVYTNACRPVMALPSMRPVFVSLVSYSQEQKKILTVDVALPLISLSHEQICHMSANAILITHCISTKHFLQDP